MPAGRRDTLIELQRFSSVIDDYGEEVRTWSTLGTEKAAVYWGAGSERREAAMVQGTQAATFAVPANSMTRSVTVTDRIVLEGVAWNITGVAPVDRQSVEITATRAA